MKNWTKNRFRRDMGNVEDAYNAGIPDVLELPTDNNTGETAIENRHGFRYNEWWKPVLYPGAKTVRPEIEK